MARNDDAKQLNSQPGALSRWDNEGGRMLKLDGHGLAIQKCPTLNSSSCVFVSLLWRTLSWPNAALAAQLGVFNSSSTN
jgi:hypothetical protein